MKKLKLKALELGAKEVLTRAQLKHVLGGDEGSGGGGGGGNTCNCNSKDDCGSEKPYCVNCSGPVNGKYGYCSSSAAGG